MESLSMQLQPFFEWLLRTTLQASLLICLILLFQAVLRSRLGARWHYFLWLLLLIRMAMPWAPQSRLSVFNLIPQSVPQRQTEYIQQDVGDDAVSSDVADKSTGESTPVSTTEVVQDTSKAITVAPETGKEAQGRLKPVVSEVATILPLIWLTGALALAVYVCVSNFNLLRIVKRERPLTDQKILDLLEDCKAEMGIRIILGIVTTDKVKSPALFGFIRPRLLLPKGMLKTLSREELRYVFLHELAHLKRHDIYIGWLISLLQVLHWFNPLIWLAFYRVRTDRELACDALVLARTQSGQVKDYGRTIVSLLERFSRSQRLPAMAGILETKAQLKRRITMIARFKKNSYQWSPLAVILIIILGCVSLPDAISTKASESSTPQSAAPIVLRRVWAGPEVDIEGAPSPDGRYLSYVDLETGNLAIYEIAAGNRRRLTNESPMDETGEFALFSRWSPDGKQIVYDWYNEYGIVELRMIGLDGSKPRILYRNKEVIWAQTYDWSPDGKQILACFNKKDGTDNTVDQIVLISVADGSVRVLKTFKTLGIYSSHHMSFSPDGHYIVYDFPQGENYLERDISLLSIDGPREMPLVEHPAHDFVLGWAPDGKHILFASDRTGNFNVWSLQVDDEKHQGDPKLVKQDIGQRFIPMGFTKDGSLYFGCRGGFVSDIYIATLDPDTGEILVPTKKVIKHFEGNNRSPDYSPDGKYLAYVSIRGNTPSMFASVPNVLCISSLETGHVREFSTKLKRIENPKWSPDGSSILIGGQDYKGTRWSNYKIDVQTGNFELVLPASKDSRLSTHEWSRDGKSYFLVRAFRNKVSRIMLREIESGTEKKIYRSSNDDRFGLSCSPDGKWLAFIKKGDKGVLQIIPATGGNSRELYRPKQENLHLRTLSWTPDGKYILLFVVGQQKPEEFSLLRIPIEGGGPQKLELDMNINNLSVHPDGQHIAFNTISNEASEIWVMKNFLPEIPAAKPEAASRAGAAGEVQQTGLVVREVKIEQGEYGLSLNRDGKRLVYPKRKGGKTNLVVRDLVSGEETQITNYETEASHSVFSPDGKEVVYTHQLDTNQLHIVSLETGEDRRLDQDGFAIDWSRDGRFILLWENRVLSLGAGSIKKLNLPSPARAGRFSPDGKYVTYVSPRGKPKIYLYPVSGGDPIQITHGSRDTNPIWSPNGKVLLFLSQRAFGPEMDLCGVSVVDGKAADDVQVIKPDFGDNVTLISLSETGRLLFRRSHMEVHLDVTPIDPQTGQPSGNPVRLADGYWPMWSPDGKRIAYFSSGWDLHVMSADGSKDQKIIRVQPFTGTHAWAADNKHIYVAESSRAAERKGVYSISTVTRERRPVYLDPDLLGHLSCSPDGRRLAFLKRSAASKKPEIFTVGVDGKNLQQLTSNKNMTVYYPAWSPDGKQIAFESGPGGGIKTLTVVSVDDGTSREIFRGKTPQDRFFEASWSPDGSKIAWQTYTLGGIRIGQVSDGKYDEFKVNLGTLTKPELKTPRWSPDGTKILFCTYSEVQHLMLMENFLPTVEGNER